jgi:hypothetical protein
LPIIYNGGTISKTKSIRRKTWPELPKCGQNILGTILLENSPSSNLDREEISVTIKV